MLIEHYKTAQSRLIRERAHCILLSMQGRHAPDIADILLRDEDTVRDWLRAYQETKLASIFPGYIGNTNASKLTPEQLAEITATLQSTPNSNTGLPGSFWSVKKLRSYLQAEYGIVYESDRSYHHLFTIFNFSFKLPEGFDRRRDDELVARRMTELTREISLKQSEDYVVFFADECSLACRKAWKKTVCC